MIQFCQRLNIAESVIEKIIEHPEAVGIEAQVEVFQAGTEQGYQICLIKEGHKTRRICISAGYNIDIEKQVLCVRHGVYRAWSTQLDGWNEQKYFELHEIENAATHALSILLNLTKTAIELNFDSFAKTL